MTTIRQINEAIGAETDSLIVFLGDFGINVTLDSELDEDQAEFVEAALRISKEIDGGKSVVDAFEEQTGSSWDDVRGQSLLDIPSAEEARAAEAELESILDAFDAAHGYTVQVVPIFTGTPEEAVAFLREHAGDAAADEFAAQVAAGAPGGRFEIPEERGTALVEAKLAGGAMEGEELVSGDFTPLVAE